MRKPSLQTILNLMDKGKNLKYMRRSSFVHQLIGKHEQCVGNGGGFTEVTSDGDLLYEYTVPPRICAKSAYNAAGAMPISALLALVDETTTWCGVALDRARRPGVSISLDAALTEQDRPPRAGDKLVFRSRAQKVGKSIAFLECDIHDAANGRQVARAGHIKAVNMGRAWNLLMADPIFPLTVSLLERFASHHRPMPIIDPADVDEFERILTPNSCDAAPLPAPCVAAFTCQPEHIQETHLMFGGLHAMLHERAAAAAAARHLSAAQCCSMNIYYRAGGKAGDELEAIVRSHEGWHGAGVEAFSKLATAGTGGASGVRSEARLEFIALKAS